MPLAALLLPVACAGPLSHEGGSRAGAGSAGEAGWAVTVPAPPAKRPVPPARAAYYRTAFPEAAGFFSKPIPKVMIPRVDAGNDTYVEAVGPEGQPIGYLRDFTGAVSPEDECACNPLKVTLAFDADLALHTLLAPEPLQKEDHEPLTDREMQRLVEIARDPPETLSRNLRVEAVLDGSTGATRTDLALDVVPLAALSTQRIVNLVVSTRRILRGAPASRDQTRLATLLESAKVPTARARAFAEFLPTAESEETRAKVYRAMAQDYRDALMSGGRPDELVEKRLVEADLPDDRKDSERVRACQLLANEGLRLSLGNACLTALASGPHGATAEAVARLEGTVRFEEGNTQAALAPLTIAAKHIDLEHDPHLHFRLARASLGNGEPERACAIAKELFREHPGLADSTVTLRACQSLGEDVDALVSQIRQQVRHSLLRTWRADGEPAPTLSVDRPNYEAVELRLGKPGKVTVLVVFATWCPHCRDEIPRIVEFVNAVRDDDQLRDRVRVVGVRTSVERETIPFDKFLAEHKPNFPILTDSTMSMAFTRLARSLDIQTALPTTAVIDERGVVRLLVEFGPYRDTVRELTWAAEAVLLKMDGGGETAAGPQSTR